jgi:predicted CXXCH cytochrome family protein
MHSCAFGGYSRRGLNPKLCEATVLMIAYGVGKMRSAAGIMLLFVMSTGAADIVLSAGESCASASCHTGIFHSTGPHDGGADQVLCDACHVVVDPPKHEFRYAASGGKLCIDCHTGLTQHDYKHEPAEQGLCTFCHSTHESQYAGQLKFPPEALCVSCHIDVVSDGARVVHGPVGQGRCVACHDPHSSDTDDYLVEAVPGLCFRCHNKDQIDHEGRTLPAVEQSFVDKSLTQHPPFARGECLLCHDPHWSNSIRLQRMPYSKAFYTDFSSDKYFCLMCHGETTFTEPRTLTATKFRNGNLNLHYRHVEREKGRGCRACHHQHASRLEAQIATDTFFGEQNIGIKAFAKSETGGTCEPLCHRPVKYDRIDPVDNVFMVTERDGVDATVEELRKASQQRNGKTLFLQRCAGCHGADAEGKIGPSIKGASLDKVMAATDRVNLMMDLASLNPADLHAIVDSLPAGTPVVALPGDVSDGTVLFSTNCAGCHGADAGGLVGPSIRDTNSTSITEAIGRVPMMIAMRSLSADSIDAISNYLSRLGETPTESGADAGTEALDGKVVFSMNCIGCHGADAKGQIGPSIVGKSTNTIREAIHTVPMMASLQALGSDEVKAVSQYLADLAVEEPVSVVVDQIDGKAFYVTNCSACHGEDASGHIGPDIRGRTADDVKDAIAGVVMMIGVKQSTEAQIKAVGEYIQGLRDAEPELATPKSPDRESNSARVDE